MIGRPTKYDPKFIDEIDRYIATTGKEQMHLPKIESFALFIGVNKDTIYSWKKKYPEFSDALGKIMTIQAEMLIDIGIFGGKEINSTIVKLLLQNNHGMKERADQTTNDRDLPVPILGGRSMDTVASIS